MRTESSNTILPLSVEYLLGMMYASRGKKMDQQVFQWVVVILLGLGVWLLLSIKVAVTLFNKIVCSEFDKLRTALQNAMNN